MKYKELIIKNRSTRGFDRSRLVTREEMLEMIDCARLSASSMSVQPLKFYMTSGVEEADLVTANAKYAGALSKLGLPYEGTAPTAYILICHDKRIWADPQRFHKDVGICAQSMSLCAVEMGLNCLMMGAYSPDKMKEILGLPDYYEIVLLLALGKSIENIELVDVDVPSAPIDAEALAAEYDGDYDKYAESHKDELKAYRIMDLMKVQYYREDGVHYAPKRKLEDILVKK